MKLRISILTLLFGLFSVGALAQQQQSDYEIQKSFKESYAEIEQRIARVSSPDSAEALIEEIKELDEKFSEHSDLLDKVLYPNTYEDRMEELRNYSVRVKEQVTKIQNQTQKLEELESQVSEYEQNLEKLNNRTDSLEQAMEESIQSEKELSAMVREYRQNLEDRDDLILAFIDSMIIAYQQMDLEEIQELEDERSRVESGGNALEMIRDISAENINIIERNSDRLALQDFMRMAEVQQQFENMWNRLGNKITEVYAGENADQLASEIEENIDQWGQSLENQTVTAIRDSLAQRNIGVSGFNSSEEMYSSISNYLDQQIEESKEGSSEAAYERYQKFEEFWNQLEHNASGSLTDAGIMERNQLATIDEKVEIWGENAEPESTNWIVWLLGVTVLIAIALGVMLVRERQQNKQT